MGSRQVSEPSGYDVVVVGGGVIGLSVAWCAARRGLSVAVVDPAPGGGATHTSAGMLAPVSEITYTEEPLLRLGLASLAEWPSFRAELEEASGALLDYRVDGTLEIAYGADDMAYLDDLAAFEEALGLRVERLTGRECRRFEPMLSPSVRGGLLARDDAWVNPRRVVPALITALEKAGGRLIRERAAGLAWDGGHVHGVRLAADGASASAYVPAPDGTSTGAYEAALEGGPAWAGTSTREGPPASAGEVVRGLSVVVAAGSWSSALAPLLPVRPVKGQILRLRGPAGFLTRCVRGLVHGASAYLVPRGDGEITLGATVEELGFDRRVTAGAVHELLRDARELVPGITELELTETAVGFRPGTPDNLPLVGQTGVPGLYAATGHHRAGVLLAPITARALAAQLAGEDVPQVMGPCDPRRFDR